MVMDNFDNPNCSKVLKALSELTNLTGFDIVICAVEKAIVYTRPLSRTVYGVYDVPLMPPLADNEAIPKSVILNTYLEFLQRVNVL